MASTIAGRAWYNEVYLKSPYWLEFSEERKVAQNHTCEDCGRSRHIHGVELHTHHKAYKDELGRPILWRERERLDLIQVLCKQCHNRVEGISPVECKPRTEEEMAELLEDYGVEPEDADTCECGGRLTYCPDCDNEMCLQCGGDCSCDGSEDDDDDDYG
jgi:hypothetical protein